MISISAFADSIRATKVREDVYDATVSSNYFKNPAVETIVRSFTTEGKMHLTREDIFNEKDLHTKLVKILVWGYPGDVRNTPTIIKELGIVETLQNQYEKKSITGKEYLKELLAIKRLGISTASKILYFMNVSIDNYPAIIIDARVVSAFPIITELAKLTGAWDVKSYIKANTAIGELAKSNKLAPEQIEYFLFKLGKEWENHIQTIIKKEENNANKQLIDGLLLCP